MPLPGSTGWRYNVSYQSVFPVVTGTFLLRNLSTWYKSTNFDANWHSRPRGSGVKRSNFGLVLVTCHHSRPLCCYSVWVVFCAFSSSRMRVINHNWSATKQRLHPQSVAEISRYSVLSGDRIWQCETSSGSRHKDTVAISFCRLRSVPVPCENGSAETTVAEGGLNLVAGLWGHTIVMQIDTVVRGAMAWNGQILG